MVNKKNRPLFTIRRIANRNPRFPRFYRASRQKFLRLAIVIFLAVVGVASLFFFEGQIESTNFDSRIESQFLQAATGTSTQDDWEGINDDTLEAESDEQAFRQEVLGEGFESISGFAGDASNPSIEKKDYGFSLGGVGTINSLLYNVKDYFKYIAGGIAILYLIIAALQIILSQDNEGIEKGKKNLFWSIFALILVFIIDMMVVTFFEGGGGAPGQSLFTVGKDGTPTETLGLFKNISLYFKGNARTIFSYLKTLIGAFTILFIFFAGAQMVMAGGSDEKIEKEKKYLMHVITAFVTILMLDAMIFGFIYPTASDGTNSPECVEFMKNVVENGGDLTNAPAECRSATQLGLAGSEQILGIVRFFETLVGAIAIFFIVYSGISIIASMGNEEIIKKHRTTLLWSLAGLAIVILANTLVTKFFFVVNPTTGQASVETSTGIYAIAGMTNFIAGFVGVFAVISIIVAGLIWVSNFGNDEIAGKAKKVILSAIVGIVLAISAYAIVNTITTANSKGGSGTSIEISI